MSTSTSRPGRALVALLVILIAGASLIFLQGTTKIRFGLDLQGGTSVVLQPRVDGTNGAVTAAAIDQAVSIIRQRVNSLGVAESEVVAQGSGINRQIVISVPGESGERVVDLVGQTAELRFRQVLAVGSAVEAPVAPAPSASPASSASSSSATPAPSGSKLTKSAPYFADPTPAPSPLVTPNTAANAQPAATPAGAPISDELSKKFASLDCTNEKNLVGGGDSPDQPLVTCDRDGTSRFVLGPAEVLGRQVRTATAAIDQQGAGGWFVSLAFNKEGTKKFGEITQRVVSLTPPQNQVAIVLDGLVVSAPRIIDAILGGQAQITGNFTQQEAGDLANVLKYGSLPLAFDRGEVQQVSPTLGSDQLRAGILAGALGLILVVIYSFFYYRALGIVTVGSLALAALLLWMATIILGKNLGFTLTLAGIAGTIVAIGITADSFIIYFERLRDEIREGRTFRSAVESAWVRARRTIIISDVVSLIAATLLFIFAIGSVRGFAFTLGLTTIIDLFIIFLFTKPLITFLSQVPFFANGHPLSGLDARRVIRGTSGGKQS
ncbi:MAG: protein translocase subunit SecD [Actinobacteria bacterium]|uniref:Protein translocase subunit SecD n=1 Tax=Candidatus Fonsibacter lacus TaxID=2576439 RepID=A0A965GCQ2_9PROT|nr:protein translocase subunit SecD [Candidatus Fonsibacter lacus]